MSMTSRQLHHAHRRKSFVDLGVTQIVSRLKTPADINAIPNLTKKTIWLTKLTHTDNWTCQYLAIKVGEFDSQIVST